MSCCGYCEAIVIVNLASTYPVAVWDSVVCKECGAGQGSKEGKKTRKEAEKSGRATAEECGVC